MSAQPCTAEGIKGGTWYTLSGGCDNFDVCSACYAGIVLPNLPPHSASQFFQRAARDPETTINCDFHPTSSRLFPYIFRLQEALDKRSFPIFSTFVRHFASLPPCPRMEAQANFPWYGLPDLRMCPECHTNISAATSPLAPQMTLHGEGDGSARTCDLYSARMRGLWSQAERGELALAELQRLARERRDVYDVVVPQLAALKQVHQAKMMQRIQAVHYGQLALQYQGMEGIATLGGTTDGYQYGSSSLGWHDTWYGAESANDMNKMRQGLGASSSSSDELVTMALLQTRWQQVE
jgi:hypothetical protein